MSDDDDVIEEEPETVHFKLDVDPERLLVALESENDELRRENRRLRVGMQQLVAQNAELKELADEVVKNSRPVHNGRTTKGRKHAQASR